MTTAKVPGRRAKATASGRIGVGGGGVAAVGERQAEGLVAVLGQAEEPVAAVGEAGGVEVVRGAGGGPADRRDQGGAAEAGGAAEEGPAGGVAFAMVSLRPWS